MAGYHYYPDRDQVIRWLEAEGLAIVEQYTEGHEDWAYWHLILSSPDQSPAAGRWAPPSANLEIPVQHDWRCAR